MPSQVATKLKKNNLTHLDAHESNIAHLKRAEATYFELAKRYNWERIDCATEKTIESLRTPENISNEVYQKISQILKC